MKTAGNSAWIRAFAALGGLAVLYGFFVRPWMKTWGATPGEARGSLPGDGFVADGRIQATRAITLEGPPSRAWPWLLQIGTRRGGWYSYDRLDNGGHPSAESILPQYQGLKVGDKVPITPDGKASFPVALLVQEQVLGLGGDDGKVGALWAMVLRALPNGKTRLIVRLTMRVRPRPLGLLAELCLEPVHFIMERKMLLELQRRSWRPGPP